MTTKAKPFTEVHPVEAASLPRPGTAAFQEYIDELVSAATELMKSTPTWKSRGRHHNIVEVRERTDWRGKRNWFLRRSVHKDISFASFKVASQQPTTKCREDFLKITREMSRNSSKSSKRQNL
jgi:hypothetical protein